MSGMSGMFSSEDKEIQNAKIYLANSLSGESENIENDITEVAQSRYRSIVYKSEVTTINSIIEENKIEKIDLLKLDVEGSEYLVLKDIHKDNWMKINQVVIEVHSESLLNQIVLILKNQGFHLIIDDFVNVSSEVGNLEFYMVYASKKPLNRSIIGNNSYPGVKDIVKFLNKKLPYYMIPDIIEFVEEFPLNINGKVDTKKLLEYHAKSTEIQTEVSIELNTTEKIIGDIWEEYILNKNFDVNDNFFEVGGNSIMLIKVVNKLRSHYKDVDIKVVDMFKYPNIRSMAKYLDSIRKELVDNV